MTNEEKDLLIAYLIGAGDIDPDGDVEAQFLEWYQVREQVVSGVNGGDKVGHWGVDVQGKGPH